MKISWIKFKNDNESFKVFKNLGFDVIDLEELENTDNVINELVQNNYKTIVMSNEVAGFSEDIIKKYNKTDNVNIIIAPSKNNRSI